MDNEYKILTRIPQDKKAYWEVYNNLRTVLQRYGDEITDSGDTLAVYSQEYSLRFHAGNATVEAKISASKLKDKSKLEIKVYGTSKREKQTITDEIREEISLLETRLELKSIGEK